MNSIISMLLTDNSGGAPTGEVAAYAWPGGYPLFYLAADAETLCPGCVNGNIRRIVDNIFDDFEDADWRIVARDVNWEDSAMYCGNCGERIESAYAEDSATDGHAHS